LDALIEEQERMIKTEEGTVMVLPQERKDSVNYML
jgi:hypothetical protein